MTTKTARVQALAVLPRNEKALQTQVLAWLRARGGYWENRSPGHFGSTGVPDITGVFLGRFVAIELKHPREHGPGFDDKRWPAQNRYLVDVWKNGGFALGTNSLLAAQELISYIAVCDNTGVSSALPFYRERWA